MPQDSVGAEDGGSFEYNQGGKDCYCSFPRTALMAKSKRKAINRNWCNQKANPALNTKAGNK